MTSRIAVLASGGGSNLQAILEHFDRLGARRQGEVVLVASDRAAAPALDRARARGIAAVHVPNGDGEALDALLRTHDAELVVLAGYLRLLPAELAGRYRGRIVNVHPSLLPAFGGHGMYGARVHQAVLAAGARVTGATVHFVDEAYDRGPIIAQWPVPVSPDDTAERLASRVLRVEHALYPRVVDALAGGRLRLTDDGVRGAWPARDPDAAFLLLPCGDDTLGREIAATIPA